MGRGPHLGSRWLVGVAVLSVLLTSCGRFGLNASPPADAGEDGAGDDAAPLDPCRPDFDEDTVLLLTFDSMEGDTFADETGSHIAALTGGDGELVAGPPGCGMALSLPGTSSTGAYVVIDDSPDWDLPAGSVDFWTRFDEDGNGGVVGRDESGVETDGHLSVIREPEGNLMARLQADGMIFYRCSDPISSGEWHHVGVNFGPPTGFELFVDGARADGAGDAHWGDCATSRPVRGTCGRATDAGLSGNRNPWVLGAYTHDSDPGSAEPAECRMVGAIDHFRISRVQRDFAR